MRLEINSKFLVFPVNTLSLSKNLVFKRVDETVYQLDVKLDNYNPDFYAYIDVSRFMGQTLDISVEPEMKLVFREADEMDIENVYAEPMRPQIHFTTKNGWNNDPNGLIFHNGVYHMFYQYNPAEPNWANMHWGHAQSNDLIHWEEKDIALFSDERGAMFSGSAVLDEKNLLGKNTENNKAVLLFYTTTTPFCQYMSYSVDGFKTIQISFNGAQNEMKIGDSVAPVWVTDNGLDITIIVDRCSMELLADGGKIFASYLNNDTLADRNIPYLMVKADSAVTLESIQTHSLYSIWSE